MRCGRGYAGLLVAVALLVAACGGGGEGGPTVCQSVLDCPSGERCVDGSCQSADTGGGGGLCQSDADCPTPGTICQDGACVPDGGTPCACGPDDECTATAPECQTDPCPAPGDECTEDVECEDDEECTLNTCLCGVCEVELAPVAGCCLALADCDDGIDCSSDACAYFHCEHMFPAGCCSDDAQCDDRDPCTVDSCTPDGCVNESTGSGCCTQASDCDDGDDCTADACVEGGCVHPRDPDDPLCGCLSDTMCDDGNACTEDRCDDRVCDYKTVSQSPPDVECCTYDVDCDDDDLGTREVCDNHVCRWEPRTDCVENTDCNAAHPCWQSICASGWCVEAGDRLDNCCLDATECDDGDPCTNDRCLASNRCQYTFEMREGCCSIDGQCDDGKQCSSEYCCQDDTCCGGNGCVPQHHCVFTIHAGDDCCVGDEQCDDDLPCTLDVCVNGTCHNLAVAGACCQTDADCEDFNACTNDTCADGRCDNLPVPNCCREDGDCEDGNDCTEDRCDGETCRHDWLPACCGSDDECNDHDVCTADRCDNGTCAHQDIFPCCDLDSDCTSDDACLRGSCAARDCLYAEVPGCCHDASECDDQDSCTEDFCVSSRCVHATRDTPECCATTVAWQNGGFEMGQLSLDPWEVVNQTFGLGWQVVSGARSVTPPYGLYYGDATTRDYGTGLSHTGYARTPPVTLPDDDHVFATFWTYLDLAGDPSADFHVSVVPGPAYRTATPLWYATALGGYTVPDFRFIELDLTPWRGQTVRLEYYFRTATTDVSSGEGVYVDDLEIGAGCVVSPVECQRDEDCADADPCTLAVCIDQSCEVDSSRGATCCATRVFTATFDDGTVQGVSTGLLPGASDTYGWSPATHRSSSSPYALYFGDPDHPCPDNELQTCPAYGDDLTPEPAGGNADIGPISLGSLADPVLRFDLWSDIDPILDFDHLDVILVSLPTEAETVLWSTRTSGLYTTNGLFQQVVIGLSPRSSDLVRVRFRFDTSGDGFGYGEGAYVDDIAVGERCD